MLVLLLFALAGQAASRPAVSITFTRDADQRLVVTVQPPTSLTVQSIILERYDTIRLRKPRTIEALAKGGRRATFDPQPDRVTILVTLSDRSVHRLEVPAAPAERGKYKIERLREAPRPLGPSRNGL
jgi:hypothetical protein